MPRNEYGLKHQETNLRNVNDPKAISEKFGLNNLDFKKLGTKNKFDP